MLFRMFRTSFALGALAVLIAAHPAFASVEGVQRGTVGYHSLVDTASSPGVDGRYSDTGNGYSKLRQLVVQAPQVRAVSGDGSQRVGWRFTVQHQLCTFNGCGSWSTWRTSNLFVATTSDSANAPFTPEIARIRLPNLSDYGRDYFYRVSVKMLWYDGNGSVEGTATAKVRYYECEASTTTTRKGGCEDYV